MSLHRGVPVTLLSPHRLSPPNRDSPSPSPGSSGAEGAGAGGNIPLCPPGGGDAGSKPRWHTGDERVPSRLCGGGVIPVPAAAARPCQPATRGRDSPKLPPPKAGKLHARLHPATGLFLSCLGCLTGTRTATTSLGLWLGSGNASRAPWGRPCHSSAVSLSHPRPSVWDAAAPTPPQFAAASPGQHPPLPPSYNSVKLPREKLINGV